MNHLYKDKADVVHECEGGRCIEIDRDTYVVWTKCEKDVPANESFKSNEKVTCQYCKAALGRG